MRAAPSSIENSVWRWRCTNDLAKVGLAPLSTALWRGLWMNHTGVVSDENLARTAAGRHEWDLHLGGGQRPVGRDQLGLVRQRRVDEPDAGAGGEHDVADAPV